MKNSSIKKYLVESYKTGTHGPAIDANIRRGYLPWGVEYSGKDRIDILYVGF